MKNAIIVILIVLNCLLSGNCFASSEDVCSKLYVNAENMLSSEEGDYKTRAENAEKYIWPFWNYCHDRADINYLMAKIKISLGDNRDAVFFANNSVKKESDNHEYVNTLGHAFYLTNDFDSGLFYMKKSIEMSGSNEHYMMSYCSSLEYAKKYDEAIKVCSKLLESKIYRLNAKNIIERINGNSKRQ